MEDSHYAYEVFNRHYERVAHGMPNRDIRILELGPGDFISSALIARSKGAKSTVLVDTGSYATKDLAVYQNLGSFLSSKGYAVPDLQSIHTFDDLLSTCNAEYHTQGLNSLKELPDQHFDFIFSQAVLEHVRKVDFDMHLRELRRLLSPIGFCSHRVDLKDHLGGALNHLRFSESVWESEFMAKSGFYTTRIRFSEMLDSFSRAGFRTEVVIKDEWKALPTPREKLAEPFKDLAENELRVSGFNAILEPNGQKRPS